MKKVFSARRLLGRIFSASPEKPANRPTPLLRLYLTHVNGSQKFSSDYWHNRQRHNGKSQHL